MRDFVVLSLPLLIKEKNLMPYCLLSYFEIITKSLAFFKNKNIFKEKVT